MVRLSAGCGCGREGGGGRNGAQQRGCAAIGAIPRGRHPSAARLVAGNGGGRARGVGASPFKGRPVTDHGRKFRACSGNSMTLRVEATSDIAIAIAIERLSASCYSRISTPLRCRSSAMNVPGNVMNPTDGCNRGLGE